MYWSQHEQKKVCQSQHSDKNGHGGICKYCKYPLVKHKDAELLKILQLEKLLKPVEIVSLEVQAQVRHSVHLSRKCLVFCAVEAKD